MNSTIITTLITAVVTIISTLVGKNAWDRRMARAIAKREEATGDAQKIANDIQLSDAYQAVYVQAMERINDLTDQVIALKTTVVDLSGEVVKLRSEVARLKPEADMVPNLRARIKELENIQEES